jgi:DNA polymerase III subunit gamma/tau
MPLAIDYRPKTFDKVAGNRQTVKALQTILNRPRKDIQHAFLLTGPSGCGKTTLARIIKDMLGCNGRDYTEVDSAQFRGIDTIRDMRGQMMYKAVEGDVRVWLIDECHQLSRDAMNGLLKALEDAPAHVFFILATTDPEKLLPTIKGRCAQFEVQPLDQDEMTDFLSTICRKERKRVPADVLKQISRDSMGSCRNALQVLDKVIDLDPEDMKAVAEQEAQKENAVIDLCRALMKREKWTAVAQILKGLEKEDPEKVRLAVMGYASTVALNEKDASKAYLILDVFKDPTYNNGRAQLVWACYTCLEG